MKKTNFCLKVLFGLTAFAIVSSCNKDELKSDSKANSSLIVRTNDISQNNLAKENLAKEISCIATENPSLLTLFKTLTIGSETNGHYEKEFFWNLEKDISRPSLNGRSISQILISANPNNATLLGYICQNIPALTILKLGQDSSTNISNKIYYDDGFDESNPLATVSYFLNCVKSTQSIKDEPTITTFIIRECETYLSPLELQSAKHLKTRNNQTYIKGNVCGNDIVLYLPPPANPNGGPTGPTGGGDDPCEEECERDCDELTENIHRFRARADYDPFRGTGEFLFYTIFAAGVQYTEVNGTVTITGDALSYVLHRHDDIEDNNSFIFPNFSIIMWDRFEDGSRMKHILYEDDGGDSKTQKTELKFTIIGIEVTQTLEYDISDGDDVIGEDIVEYCHEIDEDGFEYHPSNKVDFFLNER